MDLPSVLYFGMEPVSGKKVSETAVVMAQVMLPEDANPAGNVHGGVVMKLMDTTAYVVASRHSRRNAVTVSIDMVTFHHPVFVGDVIWLKASINMVGRTSMEVGVRVEAENFITGEIRHTSSAYITYVALDEGGRPVGVPELVLETDEDRRRNKAAKMRRQARLELKAQAARDRSPG